MLRELGKAPEGVIARANSEAARALYDSETDVARKLGVFGVPTFAVGREIFCGDDRHEQALAWATGTRSDDGAPAPMVRLVSLNSRASNPRRPSLPRVGLRKAQAALDAMQPDFYPIDAERWASEVP